MSKVSDEQTKQTIQALLRERRGYELNGTPDQVEGVNAELKRLGHEGKAPAKRAATRTGKDTNGGKETATRKASKK